MKIGTLVSNKELGRGLVMENTGAGWLVFWYEQGSDGKLFKTVICKTNTFPPHWACGGGFGAVAVLSVGGCCG